MGNILCLIMLKIDTHDLAKQAGLGGSFHAKNDGAMYIMR